MPDSSPTIARRQKKLSKKMQEGTVVSFTTLAHPPEKFGKLPRTIGLIKLEDGSQVLAPLLIKHPVIGQAVTPRMRLSYITDQSLRVYEVAYEEAITRPTSVTSVTLVPSVTSLPFPTYILALTGPSGVGKSTISKMLAKVFGDYITKVPILTTRDPKEGDDGEYIHITEEEFAALWKEQKIVAATKIPSSSEKRWYGYRSDDIEKIWKESRIPVVITEMHLLEGLSKHYGRRAILSFGLLPPGKSKRTMLSNLLHRLRVRGRDTEEHIADRLKNAEKDLKFFDQRKDLFDHVVVNEDLDAIVELFRPHIPGLQEA
jgi:guanylate kinase